MNPNRRRLIAVILFGGLAACTSAKTPRPPAFDLPKQIKVRVDGRVRTIPLDEYVLGTVLAEVSPVDETPDTAARIFEVQSVIARTYAVAHVGRHRRQGFDLCDSTHCQIYDPARIKTSRFTTIARDAVRETSGELVMFGRRPAEALFHADCGGFTTSADAVWGGRAVPYLKTASDAQPSLSHRTWRFVAPFNKLRDALNRDRRSRVGNKLDGLDIVKRDASGRVATILLRGQHRPSLRGDDLRAIINDTFGDFAIQSTKMTITRTRDAFVFAGTGFGHGVGLCQAGAAARARRGESVDDIISTYFEGAGVAKVR